MRRRVVAAVLVLLVAACGGGGGSAEEGSPSPVPPAPVEPSGTNDPPLDAEGPLAYALTSGEGIVAIDTADGTIVADYVVPTGGAGAGGVDVDPDDGQVLFHRASTGTEPQVVELSVDDGTENVRLSDAAWPATEPGGNRWAHSRDVIADDGARNADVVVRNEIGKPLVEWSLSTTDRTLPLKNLAFAPDGALAVEAELDDERTIVLVLDVDSGGGDLLDVGTQLQPAADTTELAAPAYRGEQLTVAERDTGESASGTSRVVAVGADGAVGETIVEGIEGRVLEMDWDADGRQLLIITQGVDENTTLFVWDGSQLRQVTTGVLSAAW